MRAALQSFVGFVIFTVIGNWLLRRIPAKLAENAVTSWADNAIADWLGITAPQAATVVDWLWDWGVPASIAVLIVWAWHLWVSGGIKLQKTHGDAPAAHRGIMFGPIVVGVGVAIVLAGLIVWTIEARKAPAAEASADAIYQFDAVVGYAHGATKVAGDPRRLHIVRINNADNLIAGTDFLYQGQTLRIEKAEVSRTTIQNRPEWGQAYFGVVAKISDKHDDPFSDLKKLSNAELSKLTIQFAAGMRTFEANTEIQEAKLRAFPPRNMPAAQADALWDKNRAKEDELRIREREEFRNTYLHPAIQLRHELKERFKKVGIFDPIPEEDRTWFAAKHSDPMGFDGHLSGAHPIAEMADYLEKMARRLSP